MTESSHPQASTVSGPWLWLFPATYALHTAEEGLAGERFYHWIHRVIGREVGPRAFLGMNLAYEAAMIVAVRRVLRRQDSAWIVPMLGTITTTNGIGHLVGSLVTRSYSPGLVSGLGLWTPLGLFAVLRGRRLLPATVWHQGVAAGVLVNGSVALMALPLSQKTDGTPRA
jgi:hypothetical protein